jgi:D-alanyl-lipoteichoic acid acyltransferase DltB (MBOAT superfamily)
MFFNSFEYLLFMPLVFLLFFVTADRWRWLLLLGASLMFYSALGTGYLLFVLFAVTVFTFLIGRLLGRADGEGTRRRLLWCGVIGNVAILVAMKYLPFLSESIRLLVELFAFPFQTQHLAVLVSIGVSYYVFQAISYLNDIYLEIEEPEGHFGYFFLYMGFFPKLMQGPIERAGDLLPQLKQPFRFDYENMRSGALLFATGMFKKVVIADRLGIYVDAVYGDLGSFTGLPLIAATYVYAFQIYFDFSAYTDMALGIARLFNIRLTDNFNSPYLATSVADFWRRWHITFSRWILDYIFKPLQMRWRNAGSTGTALALLVTFLVSGVWHGAGWGFVVWGLLHGLYMACSVFYRPYQKKWHQRFGLIRTRRLKLWQIFVTFNLVSFAWIFFRAGSFADALYVVSHLLDFSGNQNLLFSGFREYELGIVLGGILSYYACRYLYTSRADLFASRTWLRWSVYYYICIVSLLFCVKRTSGFIYFGF